MICTNDLLEYLHDLADLETSCSVPYHVAQVYSAHDLGECWTPLTEMGTFWKPYISDRSVALVSEAE